MMRNDTISRATAIKAIDGLPNTYNGYSDCYDKAFIIGVLEQTPTVDAVEVIHCEHCKHHENDNCPEPHWCLVWETFTDNHVYCSFAERR